MLTRFVRRLMGLDRWRPVEVSRDAKAALSLDYLTFKDLITSNDEVLEIIADLEQKLAGDAYFGMHYIRSRCVTAATHAFRMASSLNKLSQRRYQDLLVVFGDIQRDIESVLERGRPGEGDQGPLVLDFSEVTFALLDRVGGKSANLGEMRNRARLPIPEGFAITTGAFRSFFGEHQLHEEVRALLINADMEDLDGLTVISQAIKEVVTAAPLPERLEASILSAYQRVCDRLGYSPRVSLRSSALGEDGEISFAGQYVSVLNVPRTGILDAYKEVVAGLFSPRAIFYRTVHGIPDEDIPMGVACVAMVEASASGVACSSDPNRPEAPVLVINGAFGLGVGTVSGSVSPDLWEVSKEAEPRILKARLGHKETSVEPCEGGVEPRPLPEPLRASFSLSEAQVLELSLLVMAAERHYGKPQEVEWALDRLGRLTLLQCRPLHAATHSPEEKEEPPPDLDGHALLLAGVSASPGIGCGPVYHASSVEDLAGFPDGAVLVARHSSPQYVKVMGRASAIVTDIGAPTGHMASLAREFGVPAVLDTQAATRDLEPGAEVTVDGARGAVYEGRVESLLRSRKAQTPKSIKGTPLYRILQDVCARIVPLNLTDPRIPEFRPSACRTLHDVARFVHEKAFEEMFRMSDRVSDVSARSVRLAERLPYEVFLIDLGGGMADHPGRQHVHLKDIRSEPMRALLEGMMNKDLRWWEPRPISLGGFLSVATESLMAPRYGMDGERRLGDRSYAIVAESYCNFSSRIGYHFAAVDTYCAQSLSRNYISFRFKGGAADDQRRAQRCALIGAILRSLDFQIEHHGDLINARLRKFDRPTLLDRLDHLGRLLVATRQLDMRMGPGVAVDWYVKAFFEGNYLFERAPAAAARSEEST